MGVKIVVLTALLVVSLVSLSQADSWGRIVGGTNAAVGELPYVCSIWIRLSSTRYLPWCACTVLKADIVLTSASCIKFIQDRRWTFIVAAGVTNLRNYQQGALRTVRSVYRHSSYNSRTGHNDAAIIKLSTALPSSSRIQYARIPSAGCSYLTTNTEVTVCGWGMTHEQATSYWTPILQKVTLQIKNRAQCNTQYSNSITSSMSCAGYPNRGVCLGDSGAPMAKKIGSLWYVYGIAIQSRGCARSNYPGVFTDLCRIRTWINGYL